MPTLAPAHSLNFRLVLAPINKITLKWAKRLYPQYCRNFGAPSRQNSFLLGRALLAYILEELFQHPDAEIRIGAHNKPFIPESSLGFNLTHSRDWIALVIAQKNIAPKSPPAVGIDLEAICKRRNFAGLLKRTFTEEEIAWILSLNPTVEERSPSKLDESLLNSPLNFKEMERFFWLWSGKEAYLKADGRGLSGLSSLAFAPSCNRVIGELKNGALYLSTLSLEEIPHAFALYLPELKSHPQEMNSKFPRELPALLFNGEKLSEIKIPIQKTLFDAP